LPRPPLPITDSLDDARAKAFAAAGGKRVLFGCVQRGCEDPPLEDAIGSRLAWLVQDDPRWQIDAGR
jgi:hypothetical protein